MASDITAAQEWKHPEVDDFSRRYKKALLFKRTVAISEH